MPGPIFWDQGYYFHPMVRIVPDNGVEETIDLRWDLEYLPGPVQIDLRYDVVQDRRETVGKALRTLFWGYRPVIRMRFEVGGDMADHRVIARILAALTSERAETWLSLDQGETWRQVRLRRYRGPQPLGGKTFAGARFDLELEGVELVEEIVPIEQGAW